MKIQNLFKKRQIYRQKIDLAVVFGTKVGIGINCKWAQGTQQGHENVLKLNNGYTTGSNYQISLNFTLERGAVHDMQNMLNDFVKKV